ncbi:MAG: hypothetical protein LQ344_007821 [Seirophora lacunosa]|nr:MAG: hypothetical protein LQ344_007821 [Seirophora lacunosa]
MSLTFALQSLLARHEAYVLEAEADRREMAATIGKLERDKKELEAANARTIEENRTLLDQLEGLNHTVSDSESHVLALDATLQSTREELDRLNALAARTSQLEVQLSSMEADQSDLNEKLASSEEDHRSAVQRWKDAERTIMVLREQLDRIEAEAKDEQNRHSEVMNRFERRQAVERQLESAAGRLKGAATATTLGKCSDGKNNVVSHFVKDILADNASLQMGIMELREMLMGSNDEVQTLREQMMLHQVIPSDQHQATPGETLDKDLSHSTAPKPDNVPALHVHHHYHEASKVDVPGRRRSAGPRRVRKRRSFGTSGISTPRSGSETPMASRAPSAQMRLQFPPSDSTILSQTSASIPPPRDNHSHRHSIQSTHTRSSIPPSTESSSPHPSTFDFMSESSRPTSPESIETYPPPLFPLLKRDESSKSSRSSPLLKYRPFESQERRAGSSVSDHQNMNHPPTSRDGNADYDTIFEEPEHDPASSTLSIGANDRIYQASPGLRRSASHESILSIAGMPPKQARERKSQIFRGAALGPRTSFAPSSSATTSVVSSTPTISATAITAAPSSSSSHHVHQQGRSASVSGAMSTLTSSLHQTGAPSSNETKSATLGKRVGGWVWGKWGVAPMASMGDLRAKAAAPAVKEKRPTGVNQKGSLRALRQAQVRTVERARVEAEGVDEGLLRETLGEE